MAEVQAAPEPTFREQVEAAEAPVVETPEAPQELSPDTVVIEGDEPTPEKVEAKTVPLGALHEEREKRKQLQRERDQERQNFAALQQQQVQMLQYLQSLQQQPAPPPIDPETDPLGAGLQQGAKTQQEIRELKDFLARQSQEQQAMQAVNVFRNTVEADEKAFAQSTPDYYPAIQWARERRLAEYSAMGMDEAEAVQRINSEIVSLADGALRQGRRPSEVAYKFVQAMGYQPQANATQRLNNIKAGQAAATPTGGAGTGTRVSLDSLLKMDSKSFLSATAGDNWKKMASKLG